MRKPKSIHHDHFGDDSRAKIKYYTNLALTEFMEANELERRDLPGVIGVPLNHLNRVMDKNNKGVNTVLRPEYIFKLANQEMPDMVMPSGSFLRPLDIWLAMTGQRGTLLEKSLLKRNSQLASQINELKTISEAKDSVLAKQQAEIKSLKKRLAAAKSKVKFR